MWIEGKTPAVLNIKDKEDVCKFTNLPIKVVKLAELGTKCYLAAWVGLSLPLQSSLT